ncbi:MAG TPA: DUF3179 domain-containing (seleno)protein [Thermoanaerobaculia bacterium]|nr:DUF3179 domain-containing (seleno)protein [Thermoanaerobaculia bacterium]
MRKAAGFFVLLLVLLALAVVFIPAWTLQPFKAQTPEGVEMSYLLRRWSPVVTLLALAGALGLAVRLWGGARWWSRALLVLSLVPLGAAVWFSRQNHFEWMFAPPAAVASVPAAEADWVAEGDMVLAVESNGEAAAYPVRQVAYHHVVQDVVGGVPIVATY